MSFLQRLLSADFAPHGYCFLWFPEILWLHVVSDALIAVAYFAIPIALLVLARRRRELPFPWLFVMFAAFITACGLTHLMAIWTMWRPDYGVEGLLKGACALISLATAALLIPVMPKALALRSPRELEAVNVRLADEVDRHRSTSGELARAHAELEARVAERTAELVASEARYRALVEAFASVVWSTDARGMVEDNPDWRALTGQSVGEGRGLVFELPNRYLSARLLRRHGRPQGRHHPAYRRAEPAARRCATRTTGLVDAGNWAVSAILGHSGGCCLGRLHRQARASGRHRRRKPHPVHRAR